MKSVLFLHYLWDFRHGKITEPLLAPWEGITWRWCGGMAWGEGGGGVGSSGASSPPLHLRQLLCVLCYRRPPSVTFGPKYIMNYVCKNDKKVKKVTKNSGSSCNWLSDYKTLWATIVNVRNIITNRKQFNDYLLNIISAHCFTDNFPTTTYVHTVANTSFFVSLSLGMLTSVFCGVSFPFFRYRR